MNYRKSSLEFQKNAVTLMLLSEPLHELALAYIPIAANFIDEDKRLLSTLVSISMDFDCSSDDN